MIPSLVLGAAAINGTCLRVEAADIASVHYHTLTSVSSTHVTQYSGTVVRSIRFQQLAAEWRRERPGGLVAHAAAKLPAYRKIIAMGPSVVPLILEDLQRAPDHWYIALDRLTGENPVDENDAGVMTKVRESWLKWGRERGYIR